MALGKYSRVGGRKSSNYCSTVTVVMFVGFCLVGVWMLMSSSVVPIQNSESSSQAIIDEVKQTLTESENFKDTSSELDEILRDGNDMPINVTENFKDTSNELPKDEIRGDGNDMPVKESENIVMDTQEEKSVTESNDESTVSSNTVNEEQEENLVKESSDEKIKSEEGPKTQVENDEGGRRSEVESKSGFGDSKSEAGRGETNKIAHTESEGSLGENKTESVKDSQTDREVSQNQDKNLDQNIGNNNKNSEQKIGDNKKNSEQKIGDNNMENNEKVKESIENFPAAEQSDILNETNTQNGAWSTQAIESQKEKESQQSSISKDRNHYNWKLCNATAGPDYIPCLDNWQTIRRLRSTKHYEHRERHCPEEAPTCVVPLPEGYRRSIKWPKSRSKIWYYNVPHTKLAEIKGHQNWVKVDGEYLTFPGGGTQFKNGALHYIDFIQNVSPFLFTISLLLQGPSGAWTYTGDTVYLILTDVSAPSRPDIAWGSRSRVILDVGCGVASFGGFLFEKDVLAMSFAPKDEHEAQVQFALERGIPAILSVMGTRRLPYPSSVFDLIHCARCRVPWHIEGGALLLELNRVLRPGGYFVWSATPVYQKLPEDVGIWIAMSELTKSMCWDLKTIKKDKLNGVAAAIYQKPTSNDCYKKRPKNEPPLCNESDDPNAAWNVSLKPCMHRIPVDKSKRGSQWPLQWPLRLEKPPYWLNSEVGVYGKAAPEDFTADYQHWKHVVFNSYLNGIGIDWSNVRNVMDMRAVYGGFAAALKDLKMWVMNVVPIDSPDTLPIIYERGLFGLYHDWCESFSTYPRTYDLLHADHLLSIIKKRCNLKAVIAEVDRILRPDGSLIVRDDVETISEVEGLIKSLQWEIRMVYSKDNVGMLCAHKTYWRPTESETIKSAII
ncbi:hypothetical protein Patl1_08212 [Pistacia atlantica]|uniref:Uncharacterized protein n=1 Tax=Pistacia atlantica TaxID=434234 RepID=A0ACC1AH22_9ROSI|nr:hypothetical protein Patl1_08212 [Pistacia atlantica]